MTKKLEDLLNLPDSQEIVKEDQEQSDKVNKNEIAEQEETRRSIAELDKISAALPQVKGLGEMADKELNEVSDKAMQAYEDLMDLGYDYETAGRMAMDYDEYRSAMDKGPLDDYKEGGVIKKKKVISIATGKLKDYPGIKKILEMNKKGKKRFSKAEGGLMNLGGKEMDLRGGGFVPMGKKEKADDVPARLSKNEFVFTADAVRAAGGGSVQKGADLMYDTMKKLEAQS